MELDGVLITHEHYDHVGGLDDLRPFCRFRDVPVYAEQYTAERLRQRIPYCFAEHLYQGVPRITLEEIVPDSPFIIGGDCRTKARCLRSLPRSVVRLSVKWILRRVPCV